MGSAQDFYQDFCHCESGERLATESFENAEEIEQRQRLDTKSALDWFNSASPFMK
jgi:hypothetical protein